MSGKFNLWDWKRYLLTKGPDNPTYKHLLLTLSWFMNQDGESCFPSIDTLENTSSLSRPTVIKYLKKAKYDGWIKVEKRGMEGKAWSRNEYVATIPKVVKELNCKGDKAVKLLNEGGKADPDKAVNEVNFNSTYNKPSNNPDGQEVKDVNYLHPLQKFVKDKLPEVSKLKKQLTVDNCESLIDDFGKSMIRDVLLAMENYNSLTKKYKSVNLTVRNWCKRRNKNAPQSNKRPKQQIV